MQGVRDVTLTVRDLDRTAAFYERVIGLAVLDRAPGRAVLGAGTGPLLELLHRPRALPQDPTAAGLFHTAFLLPTRVDLGRWLRHVDATRQALDGAADHLVSEAVYLRDPEGNGVEVYADRDPAGWTWTPTPHGPRVVMANQPLDHAGLRALGTQPWREAPAATGIGHVHLQVGAIPEAVDFYAGLLGLDITATRPQAAFLAGNRYHHHLAVNTWNSAGAGPRDPEQAGLAAITFRSEARSEARDPWGTVIRFAPTPGQDPIQ